MLPITEDLALYMIKRAVPFAVEEFIILRNLNYRVLRAIWYITLCVSRNLLISLEIKSLLSSSISMALISSLHNGDKKRKQTHSLKYSLRHKLLRNFHKNIALLADKSGKYYLLFLLLPLLVARLTVGILRGSIELTCIFSDEDFYCPFNNLVPAQGFFVKHLLLIFVPTL